MYASLGRDLMCKLACIKEGEDIVALCRERGFMMMVVGIKGLFWVVYCF